MTDMHRYRPKRKYARTRFDVAHTTKRTGLRRTAQKPATRRLSTAARIGIGLGLLIMVVVASGAVWFSGQAFLITAENVHVANNAGVSPAQIVGASGLAGEHFAFVDLNAAAKRVDDLPGIDAAEVSCTWLGSVSCLIIVQTAQALALWETPRGLLWIDRNGIVQQALGEIPAALRVRSETQDSAAPEAGQVIAPALLRALSELADLQTDTKLYLYSARYGIISNEAGWRIRLGLAERDGEMREKIILARQLREQLTADGLPAGVIDVRFVEAPYYVGNE
ncbi:MAG: hypothetical protein RMN25_02815 [Anaerolineae bacterium]|nr:FtsQ-type POTRA domain-containing protein [Thermoflexales bacterium]MDW8406688.1 hypothetical protein [Anaerolineae bacterium]